MIRSRQMNSASARALARSEWVGLRRMTPTGTHPRGPPQDQLSRRARLATATASTRLKPKTEMKTTSGPASNIQKRMPWTRAEQKLSA
jgi:hypothetical protein